MKVPFNTVFQDNGNGSYTPKGTIRVGGVTMGTGVTFTKGVSFSGFNIAQYAGHELEIKKHQDGLIEIIGVH